MACAQRGHKIIVYTMKWQGEMPEQFEVVKVAAKAFSRHGLYQNFSARVEQLLAGREIDAVIGFNKMPGLDVYFAADPCFAERAHTQRGFYYRFMPRYRHFMNYEAAVFGEQSKTETLLLSPLQRTQFEKHYQQCHERLHDIPPGIDKDRLPPANAVEIRKKFRQEFAITDEQWLIVSIGSGFVVKGIDRALRAIASLPNQMRERVRYFIVGQDKEQRFRRLAEKLGITKQVDFLGGRDDVPRFLLGADLLLHPAYSESAGYVLLEATIAGLPVLTTDTCGYAFHIEKAKAGIVCSSPFAQQDLNKQLKYMLSGDLRPSWSANGIAYGQAEDLYSMPETVAVMIERFSQRRSSKVTEQ
jgi:UDP-glucose:(heptosyl)LPS alpha-1,3-glucosyltransferase